MLQKTPRTEAEVKTLHEAVEKYYACPNAVHFHHQKSCKIFLYTFDTAWDIFHHCASCKFNTKKPTTKRAARFY